MREKITYDRVADLSKTNDIRFVIDAHGCMIIERNAKERTCHGDLLYVLETAGSFCRLRILNDPHEFFHNGCPVMNGSVIHSGDFFRIENYSFFYRDHRLWMLRISSSGFSER